MKNKQKLNEIKRLQQLAGIKLNENNGENQTDLIKDSIEKVKEWIQSELESNKDAYVDDRGWTILNLKGIDYIIAITKEYIYKVEKKNLQRTTLLKYDDGRINTFFVSNHPLNEANAYGITHEYEKNKFSNGIIALSYNGKLIGNNIELKEKDFSKLNNDDIQDIVYSIWVEGPTFTSSQGGGHPFYDWDIQSILEKGKSPNKNMTFEKQGDNIIMITEFNPYKYVKKDLFDKYWELKSKDNKIKQSGDDIESILTNKNGKWYLIDTMNEEDFGEE